MGEKELLETLSLRGRSLRLRCPILQRALIAAPTAIVDSDHALGAQQERVRDTIEPFSGRFAVATPRTRWQSAAAEPGADLRNIPVGRDTGYRVVSARTRIRRFALR